MRMYFAGSDNFTYERSLLEAGVDCRLVSAYSLKYSKPLVSTKANYDSVLLDSGGYTARTQGIHISARQYASYLNKTKPDLAFELDTMDIEETLRNRAYLETACPNTYIIPIYHWSDYTDPKYRSMIDDLVRDYPMIAVGGVAGMSLGQEAHIELYNYVFKRTRDQVRVHGLGQTGRQMLQRYPFWSVDSTSWLAMIRYGQSLAHKCKYRRKVRSKTRHHTKNVLDEIKYFLKMAAETTELWIKRGVVWA